ncbi:MAG: O-antigen ligase family protein [Desulfotomaculaceae bacterium]|nr:O-antigen ligase family protein [Desulfotomaculaceae bacterium]
MKAVTNINSLLVALILTGGALRFITGIEQTLYYLCCTVLLAMFTFFKLFLERPRVNKMSVIYILLICFLLTWLAITSMWSYSAEQYKTDLLLIVSNLALVILLCLNISKRFLMNVIFYSILSTLLVSLFVIYQSGGVIGIKGYGTIVDEFYLTAGRAVALGFIASLIQFLYAKRHQAFWIIVAVIHVAALSICTARGPLIFSLLIVLMLFSTGLRITGNQVLIDKSVMKRYLTIVIPVAAAAVILALQVDSFSTRLIRLMSFTVELSEGGRGAIWQNALASIEASPLLGYGLGSSGIMSGAGENLYAHNLILQVWLDGGALGLLLLIPVIMLPVVAFFKNRGCQGAGANGIAITVFCCYILLLLEYSKSHSFYIARDFLFFGLATVQYLGGAGDSKEKEGAVCIK